MTCNSDEKRKSRLGAWIAPTVVSVIVFSVLFLAYILSPIASVAIAMAIIVAGVFLLKLL